PRRPASARRSPERPGSTEAESRPRILASQNRDDLEIHQVLPAPGPGLERVEVRRLHHLETPAARRVDPAGVVEDALGEHPAAAAEALADGPPSRPLDPLDYHVEHEGQYTPGAGRAHGPPARPTSLTGPAVSGHMNGDAAPRGRTDPLAFP